jgi:hypothetical protein
MSRLERRGREKNKEEIGGGKEGRRNSRKQQKENEREWGGDRE